MGCNKHYIGETNNLRKRTTLHNQHIRHEHLRMIPITSPKELKYFISPFYKMKADSIFDRTNKQIPWGIYVPPPPLFLFEVLKMGKVTRGPLVLYHLPKYWSRKPVIKYNFRVLKKTHAYFMTILKAPVKFQKDRLKTVVGVTGTRYLLPIRFCSIRTQKMSKLKMRKK